MKCGVGGGGKGGAKWEGPWHSTESTICKGDINIFHVSFHKGRWLIYVQYK